MNLIDIILELIRLTTRPIIVFPLVNIILFGLLSIILLKRIKSKMVLQISLMLVTTIIILELGCLIIINKFIGYEFIIHFNVNDYFHMLSFYKQISIIMIIVALVAYYILNKILNNYNLITSKIIQVRFLKTIPSFIIEYFLIAVSLFILFGESKHGVKGILNKKLEALYLVFISSNKSFSSSLEQLNMHNYIYKDSLSVENQNGHNVIIISLESFENAFLNHPDTTITSFFRYLKNNWNYITINQNIGSNWTAGSIYTMMTGMPSLFGLKHNSVFSNSFKSKFTTVPDIFKKINYKKIYIADNSDFAGTRAMLNVFGFDKIIDKKQLNNEFDKDIFEAAKEEIFNLENLNINYFLLLSTLDTHAPYGRYDNSFQDIFPNLKGIEYSIAVINYLIEDFISYLEKNNFLENTIVTIVPDHLFMGKTRFMNSEDIRSLFFITNSKYLNNNNINLNKYYQLDIPKLILSSSGINHNVKFFSDYYTGDLDSIVKAKQSEIKSLNISGFARYTERPISNGSIEKYNDDKSIFIAHAGGQVDANVYTNSLNALDYNYSLGVKYFELDIHKTSDNMLVAVHDWDEWALKSNWTGAIPPSHSSFMANKILNNYRPLDIEIINNWFSEHKDAYLMTDKINSPNIFFSKFNHKNRLIMEIFDFDSLKVALSLGINVSASQNILDKITLEHNNKILSQVEYITISQEYYLRNSSIIRKLYNNGVKPLVYGVNNYFFSQGDNYHIYNERDFYISHGKNIHGIYVDDFTLLLKNKVHP